MNENVTFQRKHFSLKLGRAITVHNSQGSTLENMKGDFDCISKNGKSEFYQLTNEICMQYFHVLEVQRNSECIKANTAAL